MSMTRIRRCDVKGCEAELEEEVWGQGHDGWGQLLGIVLDGVSDPNLCPEHLKQVADFVDSLGVE